LIGAAAFGGVAGFAATMMMGRVEPWVLALIAAPVLAYALHLTGLTLSEALSRRAYGCSTACVLHGAALLAWPMTAMLTPIASAIYWVAPITALSALILFASCWGGASRPIYRMSVQGALVAALAVHQGVFVVLGA